MELTAGVYWIEEVRSNVYACVEDDTVTLIDTGLPGIDRVDLIFNYLERLDMYPQNVRRIVVTHADGDHVGNAAGIRAETGAPVWAGLETAHWLMKGKQPPHPPPIVGTIANWMSRYTAVDEKYIRTIAPGDELPVLGGLRAIATPGHTADHVSFYSPSTGVLFAGDALNTRGDKLQSSPRMATADTEQARTSALTLLDLCPTVIACGHGRPWTTHTAADLRQARDAIAAG